MRFQVWACQVGDLDSDGTIFNRVVDFNPTMGCSNLEEFIKKELRDCCNHKTVVVKVETLGTVSATSVLVFERTNMIAVYYSGEWVELTDDLIHMIIEKNRVLYLGDVEWRPDHCDVAVVKKLLLSGVSICVGSTRERLDIKDQDEYVLSLRF